MEIFKRVRFNSIENAPILWQEDTSGSSTIGHQYRILFIYKLKRVSEESEHNIEITSLLIKIKLIPISLSPSEMK